MIITNCNSIILKTFNFIYPNTYFELFVCHLFYSLNKFLPSATPTYLCRAILTGKVLIGHSKAKCLTVGKEKILEINSSHFCSHCNVPSPSPMLSNAYWSTGTIEIPKSTLGKGKRTQVFQDFWRGLLIIILSNFKEMRKKLQFMR